MNAFLALLALQTPFVAKEAGLSWRFSGKATWTSGHYDLVSKEFRGEVFCFTAPKGHYDAETLFQSDTKRTENDVAARDFSQVKLSTQFAGMPALLSDQRYSWNGALVASRCIYAAQGNKAWIVRLWWPRASSATGDAAAEAFLKSCHRMPEPPTHSPNG